tara:strand:- start:492 stop:752 length:261 start_codon:yes stop_codon:yes gene_type:complete
LKKIKVNTQQKADKTIVEVFKTNVGNQHLAEKIISELNQLYPEYRINFDLEDCDKVLRIESNNQINLFEVINYGRDNGFQIELIDY